MAAEGTMKAVTVEVIKPSAREGIEAAVIMDIPRKPCGDGEVRISVRSAALNFPELLMLQGKYQFKPSVPFTLTIEGAGVVTELGSKASGVNVGDRVMFNSFDGCASEEVVVRSKLAYPIPDGLSFSQGACFMTGYTTAYHGLVHRGRLQPGEWLLVTGAGGGMGSMAVELGKALGARVIAAASSDEKLALCTKLGADATVNYSKVDLKKAVGEITGGAFCDVIYEVVGGKIFDQCVRCVATAGYARLVVVGFASGTIPQLPANMSLIKGFDLVGVRAGHQILIQPKLQKQILTELMKLANAGKLKPPVSLEVPMERFKEALYLLEEQKILGKCCITFGGSSKL